MNATPKKDLVHRWLFSKVDWLCASSENLLRDVEKNFPIAPEKLKLIRYGRPNELFKSTPESRKKIREQYNAHQQLVVGTLCRIDPGKGVKELASSLDFLTLEEKKQVQLWIIGDPTIIGKKSDGTPEPSKNSAELLDWLQEKIKTEDQLKHIPFQKDYIPFLDAMDIFALASYNETYSLSVLDAMMMEKPVLGTNAGGTPEQVGKNERGYLVQPRSAEDIANALRYYLINSETRLVQGQQARAWAQEKHSWSKTMDDFLGLYVSR